VVHQGRIERFFLDNIRKYSDIEVERGVMPESLAIDESVVEDPNAYPITVQLRHLTEEEATPAQQSVDGGTTETVQDGLFRSNLADDDTDELLRRSREKDGSSEIVYAKYLIGCDGAHSWTRRQIGAELEGEPTDFIWGVLDIVPITDFPDIRCRCMIHSESNGSLMNIPRENNLTRLYIQLTEVKPDASGRADRSKITPEIIIKAAQRIIAPYKLEYTYCDWYVLTLLWL
jgi:phenol 2-monooxygenase